MQQRQPTGGRTKALLIFGISLMAAIAAVFLVFRVVKLAQQEVTKARESTANVEVLVATRDLNVGIPIEDSDVALRALAAEMVPAVGVFHVVHEAVGRVPRERILANELVRDERLALADAGVGLNALVSPGKRAMSVAVDAETGVAGFIQPGNYVDVIVTIRPDDMEEDRKWVSKAFLQGIKVLAVGRRLDSGEDASKPISKRSSVRDKPTVTLELTLEQSQELALSATRGDIHIVLRNDIDITQQDTQGVATSGLVGLDPKRGSGHARPVVATPAQPTGPVSEIITGDTVQEVQFGRDGTKSTTVRSDR
jgi:pilus assembly protein CpaB